MLFWNWFSMAKEISDLKSVHLSSLLCLRVYAFCPQCWCWTHRNLHSHRSFDLPDWKGKYCGRVWHRPWSAHAPASDGADRGRIPSRLLRFLPQLSVFTCCSKWWVCCSSVDFCISLQDQYVFLHQCAMDIIRSRTGTNVDLIYQNTAALSIYENVEPRKGFPKNGYHNA